MLNALGTPYSGGCLTEGHTAVVEVLMKAGANLHIQDKDNRSGGPVLSSLVSLVGLQSVTLVDTLRFRLLQLSHCVFWGEIGVIIRPTWSLCHLEKGVLSPHVPHTLRRNSQLHHRQVTPNLPRSPPPEDSPLGRSGQRPPLSSSTGP